MQFPRDEEHSTSSLAKVKSLQTKLSTLINFPNCTGTRDTEKDRQRENDYANKISVHRKKESVRDCDRRTLIRIYTEKKERDNGGQI